MVFFTCNKCGESLKKKDVEKHTFTRCRGPPFLTCVDCLKDFRDDYVKHTVCVSEDARYSAKGLSGLTAQPKTKQQLWVETVQDTVQKALDGSTSGITPGVRHLLEFLADKPTLPDKAKTFTNFIKNARRNEPQENIDFIWSLLEKARAALQAKLQAERLAAEQARKKAKEEKEAKKVNQNGKTSDSSSSSDSSDEDDDSSTKKEKMNKKMKELTVSAPSETQKEEPSKSSSDTGVDNHVKSEKKKKKKNKSNDEAAEQTNLPDSKASLTCQDNKDSIEKKKKKKRELSESESVFSTADGVDQGEKGKKNKKKRNNTVCEPAEVEGLVENDAMEEIHTEENEKENAESSDKKLSKKERKEKKKREKYEAQLKEIESNKSNETGEEETKDKAIEDEEDDSSDKKKSKNKVKATELSAGNECCPEGGEKKSKKNKKRLREDDQNSKLTSEVDSANKKIKDSGVKGEIANVMEQVPIEGKSKQEFQWDKTIIQLLESHDKEMPIKRLCKKVVSEYLSTLSEDAHIDEVKINSKFHKKLAKMHNVVVLKDKAKLKTSRD